MAEENQKPYAGSFIQITMAGNLVVCDPLTGEETFFTANEERTVFTNPKGNGFSMEQIILFVDNRLRMRVEQEFAKMEAEEKAAAQPAAPAAPAAERPNFCVHCGAKLAPDAKFCTSCGAAIQ